MNFFKHLFIYFLFVFVFTVLFLGGEKNHTGSTNPSQKENAMKMIYIFFIKRDHVLKLNILETEQEQIVW